MELTHNHYDDDCYWLGYDGNCSDETLRNLLCRNYDEDREFHRSDATAPDTYTAEDLEIFSDMFNTYEHVELVRMVRS